MCVCVCVCVGGGGGGGIKGNRGTKPGCNHLVSDLMHVFWDSTSLFTLVLNEYRSHPNPCSLVRISAVPPEDALAINRGPREAFSQSVLIRTMI